MTRRRQGRPLSGRDVLVMLVAFFALVFAANGAFVYLALRSWPGLVSERAYLDGLAYNRMLGAAAAQRAAGLRPELAFRLDGNGAGELSLRVRDRDGRPVDGLEVTAEFVRPTNEGFDLAVALGRRGPGLYGSEVRLPLKGQWDVRLRAAGAGAADLRLDRRLWLE